MFERDVFLFELTGNNGVRGVGEAAPLAEAGTETAAETQRALQNAVSWLTRVSLPVEMPGQWEPELLRVLHGVPAARCAVDVAIHDWLARTRGRSIAALLAAEPCASPAVHLKLKVGRDLDAESRALEALRTQGSPHLRIDANGAWRTIEEALAALELLGTAGIELVEQPIAPSAYEELLRFRDVSPLPVFLDESIADEQSARTLLRLHAADGVVLKPMRLGGLRPCLRIARLAAASGVRAVVTSTLGGEVDRIVAAHVAAALGPGEAHGIAKTTIGPDVVGHGVEIDDRVERLRHLDDLRNHG